MHLKYFKYQSHSIYSIRKITRACNISSKNNTNHNFNDFFCYLDLLFFRVILKCDFNVLLSHATTIYRKNNT